MKDWIVDIEQKGSGSKGLRDAYGYMQDGNRPSHYDTEITVLGNDRAFQNTVLEFDSLNQRGRTINNFATSAMLSMPNDLIHPTNEEWALIADELLKNYVDEVNSLQDRKLKAVKPDSEVIEEWQKKQIKMELPEFTQEEIEKKLLRKRNDEAKYLNQRLDLDTVKKTTGLIIHNEENGKKSSHLNVLISNIQDGEYKKVITQYGGVNALKKAYNKAVLEVLGLDNKFYTPEQSRLPDQPAYDVQAPFVRKKLEPETIEKDGKKIRKKRRRKKPFAVAQAEKKEAERVDIELNKAMLDSDIEVFKTKRKVVVKAVKDVNKARKGIKKDTDEIRDEKANIAFEKKIIEGKEEKLNKKISAFNKVMETFNKWINSFRKDEKKAELHAKETAEAIIELEETQPKRAKKVSVMAQNEEDRKKLLGTFKEETKVSHHLKNRPTPFKNPNSMRPG